MANISFFTTAFIFRTITNSHIEHYLTLTDQF